MPHDSRIPALYRAARYQKGLAPALALADARRALASPGGGYPFHAEHARALPAGYGNAPFNISHFAGQRYSPKRDSLVWIENPHAAGLREVGTADAIAKLDHNGWYSDNFQSATIRGGVWQLASRGGFAQFVAGYYDPHNSGPVAVCVSEIFREKLDSEEWSPADMPAARDAARFADGLAESMAESERDYDSAWQAGNAWRDKLDELASLRTSWRTAAKAARDAIQACREAGHIPAARRTAAALLEHVASDWRGIKAARARIRREMEALASGDDSAFPFPMSNREAFNESAGRVVI